MVALAAEETRRRRGRYYTRVGTRFGVRRNPFGLPPFRDWLRRAGVRRQTHLLEPFAGANHLVDMLRAEGVTAACSSFDIEPAAAGVVRRDTLRAFPRGFEVCVTNPPWLARNSATRRGLGFPPCPYDDLYKHCLALCLAHCRFVAALLPATYLQSGLFRERLGAYVLLHDSLFAETENPVCLALFDEQPQPDVAIYHDAHFVGWLGALARHLPSAGGGRRLRFNDPQGPLGLVAFDNTRGPSIAFCAGDALAGYRIGRGSRCITRISDELGGGLGDLRALPLRVERLNDRLAMFRERTADVFLTPFKGLRGDGRYRRRIDFGLARRWIDQVLAEEAHSSASLSEG